MTYPFLSVSSLLKEYTSTKEVLVAVDNISFTIDEGEIIGVVGESGCGKSTLGKLLACLEIPSQGSILYKGLDINKLAPKQKKEWRKEVQYIFQDSSTALNPMMNVLNILREPFIIQSIPYTEETIRKLLSLVHLPSNILEKFPHELSGGQRQRVSIARALALEPKLLICDEPIASVDISIGKQIIDLLKKLQKELSLTVIFISHDLRAVKEISSKVFVMYLGKIVEISSAKELYISPAHPYTEALLSSIPIPDPVLEKKRTKTLLKGDPSLKEKTNKGCVFVSRCPKATAFCKEKAPPLDQKKTRQIACHFPIFLP